MQLDASMENITPVSSCPAVTAPCCWLRHSLGLGVTDVSLSPLGPSWHRNTGCRKLCLVAALKTRVQICFTAKITRLVMRHRGYSLEVNPQKSENTGINITPVLRIADNYNCLMQQ